MHVPLVGIQKRPADADRQATRTTPPNRRRASMAAWVAAALTMGFGPLSGPPQAVQATDGALEPSSISRHELTPERANGLIRLAGGPTGSVIERGTRLRLRTSLRKHGATRIGARTRLVIKEGSAIRATIRLGDLRRRDWTKQRVAWKSQAHGSLRITIKGASKNRIHVRRATLVVRKRPTPTTPTPTPTTPTPTTPTSPYGPWPTVANTGPRYSSLTSTGALSSTSAGQVIERTTVTGKLTVRHDNVTVRDVTVLGTGTYMVQVLAKADGTCPVNVRFEYVEIDGARAAENDIPLYSPDCGYTFDHGYVHNVGRASRVVYNTTISNSYIFSDRTGDSGAHRGGVGNNGGTNNALINNVIKCQGTGCSAALPMYGDFRPVNGYLIQHNLLATTGSYCAYGGSLDSKPYPDGSNIRFIDNHFATDYFSTCGRYGPISGFEGGVRGNVWTGNVWYGTGRPVPPG